MNAEQALMSPLGFKLVKNSYIRGQWIRWWIEGNLDNEKWVVYREPFGGKGNKILYAGYLIEDAISTLLTDYNNFLTKSEK